MSSIRSQLASQVRFDLLAFRRTPAATFFTVVLPLVFLILLTAVFGDETMDSRGGIRVANFYVPGILGLAIVSATMVNLAITTVTRREQGILKRVRGTPLRPSVFLASLVIAAIVIASAMTVVVLGVGRLLFDVSVRWEGVPALLVTLVLGAAAFCAMGLALTTVIPSVSAAPAITNAIVLPLYFVSEVFLVTDGEGPRIIEVIGDIFPVKHLVSALFESVDPLATGWALPLGHWAVLVAWGALGAVVAVTRFRWTPWDS